MCAHASLCQSARLRRREDRRWQHSGQGDRATELLGPEPEPLLGRGHTRRRQAQSFVPTFGVINLYNDFVGLSASPLVDLGRPVLTELLATACIGAAVSKRLATEWAEPTPILVVGPVSSQPSCCAVGG